ncbi:MAG: HAMP domain-containing sensor histidine kinase [Bryobacteraceae bacterium]|jgi:signal transduction histidine kinase
MNIVLVSEDRELYRVCLEILDEILHQPWTLSAASLGDAISEADLCIWDYQADGALPYYGYRFSSKHLYLVSRKDLPGFRQQTSVAEANILLKPVTPVTLAAFLGSAVSSRGKDPLREDRDEILQCLVQTNLALQEYDQDRTNFLARAVHDFRAPLTAVSGYCGLMLDESFGPINEEQREVLGRMRHSAQRLSRMASAMFQLSIARHVKKRPNFERGDLQECLDQALHEISPFADERRITITPGLEPGDEGLLFDPEQMEQVLINILDNACKFTPKAGAIEIRGYPFFWERRSRQPGMPPGVERRRSVNPEPNSYRIDIADSGAAIPQEHLDTIFEEYASYSGGRDRSGGGLGLAICRLIVTQHDGRVWAENTDSGPRFSIVLPLDRSQLPVGDAEEDLAFENYGG